MTKTFHWIVKYSVNYDSYNRRDDQVQDRKLFYGTYDAAKEMIESKHKELVDAQVKKYKKELKEAKEVLRIYNQKKEFYDSLSSDKKSLIDYSSRSHNYAVEDVKEIETKINKVMEKYEPHEQWAEYWEIDYFDNDEDQSIIGFKENE